MLASRFRTANIVGMLLEVIQPPMEEEAALHTHK